MCGWIKLYRKSYDNFLYKTNKPHTRREAWEDMLMLVNYEDCTMLFGNEVIECKRGQSLKSLESWGMIFNWNKSKVKRFFQLLTKMQMIVTENVHKTTRITICNYDDYQGDQNPDATPMTCERNLNDIQTKPIKEEEEIKKNKKVSKSAKSTRFTPPTELEIKSYIKEKKYNVNATKFFCFYESKGWMVGRNKMKNWKASVRTWNCKNEGESKKEKNKGVFKTKINHDSDF